MILSEVDLTIDFKLFVILPIFFNRKMFGDKMTPTKLLKTFKISSSARFPEQEQTETWDWLREKLLCFVRGT